MDQKSLFSGDRRLSRDDVGDQAVLEKCNFVAKPQLALLHARKLQLIGLGQLAKRTNRAIQVPVLDPQKLQSLLDLFHRQHRLGPSNFNGASPSSHCPPMPATMKGEQEKFVVNAFSSPTATSPQSVGDILFNDRSRRRALHPISSQEPQKGADRLQER